MFPRLFHLGSLDFPTYGLMAALGLMVGLSVCVRLARREGIDPEQAWNLGLLAILAAIAGAKLFLLLDDWSYYSEHWGEFFSLSTLRAGGVWYGGLLVALAAAAWYIRRHHLPVRRVCDAFAPGVALGHAIGRLGCFAAGCCYGKPTRLPWGVIFTNPLAAQWSGTPLGVRLHPTQLYEAAVELANFFLLAWLLPRKKFDGEVIGAYMALYGFARFFLEFLRDDPERGSVFGGALTLTQLVSILLVVGGGLLWLRWGKAASVARPARG
ncbi:MAG TPA: prolipoprotein diacylglyceryl transferase [Terriglobales bacterium]|nr:prolipoprotein diacylglyceryl transferase [Terriglobales bacterium]